VRLDSVTVRPAAEGGFRGEVILREAEDRPWSLAEVAAGARAQVFGQ
jgi:hypothetical protein